MFVPNKIKGGMNDEKKKSDAQEERRKSLYRNSKTNEVDQSSSGDPERRNETVMYEMVCFYRKDLDSFSTPFPYPSLSYCIEEFSKMLTEKADAMSNGTLDKVRDADLDLIPLLEFVKVAEFDNHSLKFTKSKRVRVRAEDIPGMKEVYERYVQMVNSVCENS